METEASKIERNKFYTKRVKVSINRTGRDATISAKHDVIDGGANDEFIKIRPGDEVIIKEKFLYCFTDAVIEKDKFERNAEGEVVRQWKEYIPRFEIRINGYYVSDERFTESSKDLGTIPTKLYPITEEQFKDSLFDMEAYVREYGEREQAYREFKEKKSDRGSEVTAPEATV